MERLIFTDDGPSKTAPVLSTGRRLRVVTEPEPEPEPQTEQLPLGEDDVDLERVYELWRSDDLSWKARAACRGMSPDLFFPGRGNNSFAVKAICAGCPVRTECLAWGTANEGDGIWGGFAERARSRFRMRMRARGWDLAEPIRHGSRATYQKYGCRCAPCRAAKTDYDRGRREPVR